MPRIVGKGQTKSKFEKRELLSLPGSETRPFSRGQSLDRLNYLSCDKNGSYHAVTDHKEVHAHINCHISACEPISETVIYSFVRQYEKFSHQSVHVNNVLHGAESFLRS